MNYIQEKSKGFLLCLSIAIPSWFIGQQIPIIGGPVIAIIAGMILSLLIKDKKTFQSGITFTSKKILQWAVVLLGFDTSNGEAFGIFAGTAVNDTSSVTAAAATWDSIYNLGTSTLDKAVTVKLTRTLAIIPITLVLAFLQARKSKAALQSDETGCTVDGFRLRKSFPFFIIYFILAAVITTVAGSFGVPAAFFAPVKILSKFFIVLAMAAIGLNSNIIKLIKTGGKPLFMGFCCWISITCASLIMQHIMGLW